MFGVLGAKGIRVQGNVNPCLINPLLVRASLLGSLLQSLFKGRGFINQWFALPLPRVIPQYPPRIEPSQNGMIAMESLFRELRSPKLS